ncbi:MAG: type I 3-dehydroquinate dehydratase [Clostridia bacterium]|nr:type I 3-dehydroquinate dehydratase [Clostridia bacterium]MBO4884406.1 type I 3-dehydroquinate dehydratase [Clostridia bacterium]MBR4444151.1 type I 3-dehydroquinate dehydratase [Clostridia bacterium]
MKQTFLTLPRPFVCALIMQDSLEETIAAAHNADFAGAQAIGVHMRMMPAEDKTPERLAALTQCTVRPVLAMHYRNEPGGALTDEDRAEFLLNAARAGASIVDVMGDFYDPSPREWSGSEAAVARQRQLIERIHRAGSAVVMSSHMKESLSAEEALTHLRSFEERGADVVKIVPQVNTESEMQEAFRTILLLRRELKKPFIYVAGGRYGRHQRAIAPMFGSMLSFGAYPAHCRETTMFQQPVETLRALQTCLYEHLDTDL